MEKIKFAHIADCHLGGWRKESLNALGYAALRKAIDKIIENNIDFVIISGDLYDNSNPKVDVVDVATEQLKRLYDEGIPVYGIMGSHDFSPSGRSMIRPLKSAEFFHDLFRGKYIDDKLILRFTQDEKTNVKLTGIRARKRALEIEEYRDLDKKSLEEEPGPKIFVLHTMVEELKPKEYKRIKHGPKSLLPNGFIYYAGGHLHKTVPVELRLEDSISIKKQDELIKKIIYPGCLFPNNFLELEKLRNGGFCIVEYDSSTENINVQFQKILIKEVLPLNIDANNKSIQKVRQLINDEINAKNIEDKIITMRIMGQLASGKAYELNVGEITQSVKEKGAYEVLINKAQLLSPEYKSIRTNPTETMEKMQSRLIHEHSQNFELDNLSKNEIEEKTYKIIEALGEAQKPEERKGDYNEAMLDSFYKIMNIKREEDT